MNPYSKLNERQASILRALQDAHARSPSSAVSLHAIQAKEDRDLDSLLELRIVCRTGGDPATFYAPLSGSVFGPALSRRVDLILIFGAIAVMVAVFAMLILRPPLH